MSKSPAADHDEWLEEQLNDGEFSRRYLVEAARNGTKDELMLALGNLARAHRTGAAEPIDDDDTPTPKR